MSEYSLALPSRGNTLLYSTRESREIRGIDQHLCNTIRSLVRSSEKGISRETTRERERIGGSREKRDQSPIFVATFVVKLRLLGNKFRDETRNLDRRYFLVSLMDSLPPIELIEPAGCIGRHCRVHRYFPRVNTQRERTLTRLRFDCAIVLNIFCRLSRRMARLSR